MVNHQLTISKHTQKNTSNKRNINGTRKHSKNSKRRIRRKRNKFRYYQALRKQRTGKRTDELCDAVEVFDIIDMDWSAGVGNNTSQLPAEIIEWQKRDQIAFWKSKALSLELENKMLRQHLRNVYAKTIQDYDVYNHECLENGQPEQLNQEYSNFTKASKSNGREENIKTIEECEIVKPNFPECKNRSEELRKIYGDKAPKILGMETALQLNYERHLEKSKPSHWPNLPLNC